MNPERGKATTRELLVFELARSRYALPLECIREVVPAVFITRLPSAPAVIEGVIYVRGEMAVVYDLRARFGLPPVPLDPAERMIIAWTGDRLVAMRCDRADWIEQAPAAATDAPARLGSGARHVAGVVRLPDDIVLIHDLPGFLEAAEREALDRALEEQVEGG